MTTMWLTADYHFPSTYSCRIPMSSMSSASAMPAPGPATVRLALLRTGIEYVGYDVVRDELFPTLCAMPVRIRPPERVALSQHHLRAYKWETNQAKRYSSLQESVIVREIAHASGPMTISIEVPADQESLYRTLLRAVGYWGQTDSLTSCVGVTHEELAYGEYAVPFRLIGSNRPQQSFFHCVTSEFRTTQLSWEDVTSPFLWSKNTSPVRLDVYVWPLVHVSQPGGGKLLLHHKLPS